MMTKYLIAIGFLILSVDFINANPLFTKSPESSESPESLPAIPPQPFPGYNDSSIPLNRTKRSCTKCVGHHGLCVIGEGNCNASDGCFFCGGCGSNEARCQDPNTESCQCYK